MSLINFLNPKLKPSLECDAVCEDGYPAANLIADDAEQLSRGFMAFSVTKPPVEIVFDFPKAVDLKVIKLWNSNGALRSTAFEVHGKYDGIWERVAYVRDLAKGVDSLTFCYQSDYSSRNAAENATAQQKSDEKVFFFKTAHKILANTNSLKIIVRATQKCAPVLRKVQVWGLPSRSLEKADRELVKTIWSEITNPYDQHTQQQSGQRSPSRNAPELTEHSTLKIPEEFLDAITWELMIFPTVLPSGKVVDQSTIDKHSEVEAKWGRLPSDPFTGLEFTSYRKAILNLALKARIEKFLMENSEHFKTVPRSLGSSRVRRSKNRHASQFASLHQSHSSAVAGAYSSLSASSAYKTSSSSKSSATATLSSAVSASASSTLPPPKRAKLSSESTSATYRSEVPLITSTQTMATATAASLSSSSTAASTAAAGIDQVIQQALQKLTRFTRPSAMATPATCISCKSPHFAYEIQTCKHLVCRGCLVTLADAQMCTCKTSFRSADVERYHKL